MPDDRIAVLPHKALPLSGDDCHCALCGMVIKRVPGGSGPVWIHDHSGAVAGFPDASTRRVVKGLMDELGPSPWDAGALTKLANWLARLGFAVEESDASVEEYIAGLAMANARNNQWRCTDRDGRQLLVAMHVQVLGPRKDELHQGRGSVTRLLPGIEPEVPNVVVTDDNGTDITVNCVNVMIEPPGWV